MNPSQAELRRIELTLTDREDGGLHISSSDVPGLHLSGADKHTVWRMVPSAVTTLLAANSGLHVLQVYLPAEEQVLGGPNPRDIALHARCATLVVELEAA